MYVVSDIIDAFTLFCIFQIEIFRRTFKSFLIPSTESGTHHFISKNMRHATILLFISNCEMLIFEVLIFIVNEKLAEHGWCNYQVAR